MWKELDDGLVASHHDQHAEQPARALDPLHGRPTGGRITAAVVRRRMLAEQG